jgi:hypothetical protein
MVEAYGHTIGLTHRFFEVYVAGTSASTAAARYA